VSSRELYEGVLIELNKDNATNILLEDFNYFANKAINNYTNKRYNIYDISQQTTDDLRVLKATAMLKPTKVTDYTGLSLANGANYEIVMPSDYLHLLNCICIYKVKKTFKCYNAGDTWRAPAKRLTADMYSQVMDNFWNKPTYKKPYYYIHNVNSEKDSTTTNEGVVTINRAANPTNPYNSSTGKGTDISSLITTINSTSLGNDGVNKPIVEGTGGPESIKLNNGGVEQEASLREKGAEIRYGNRSEVRVEIRYGTDDSVFELTDVYIDYIKAPQHIRLTQKQLDTTEDTSQLLEFPDYVCQEIINELVTLIMENISDQRLQTHPVVSQSIANPAQQ
jgi:hypothetical protein